MSNILPVTVGQTECLRKMAHEKGVSREQFQQALDDTRVAQFLESLKTGSRILMPPPGARIHRLEVSVTLDHSWQ